ncbi:hypothetical protein GUITHDRAFT_112937 [Guillardia theta CCMP2712]|uniref:Uncharacterized protein n=1 Tax=Guillardia theta (strain CCMP2712) TaxID=905079 RepID=L1IYF8_GUITC|nr:hypothetical protein GUITHDRAFT_112937 [Guillardia theta CCMP2712]EKX40934.1 hypothetical protein GUITHDRAFT_112937 [Guillardia theta CCMP2712]|eukprot:XP_005827914.1 hypothetical protein GUITHDRAFT_112937 [Guillardia theta CCMP2712]
MEGERKQKKEGTIPLKARLSSAMMAYPFVGQVAMLFAVLALSCVLFASYDRTGPGVAEEDMMLALNLSSYSSRSDGYLGRLTYRARESFQELEQVWQWLDAVIARRVIDGEPTQQGAFLPFWWTC